MKRNGFIALLLSGFVLFFLSCTKLNTPTELGDELLPAVDNVNTFDTTLSVQASYHPFDDSSLHFINENMALGRLIDPVFGNTTADMYFNLSSTAYGSSPFYNRDSVQGIDSVVLQLAYVGSYGDTSASSQLSVAVSEISSAPDFVDTVAYRYDHPGFNNGTVLGTKTFSPRQLADTQTLIRRRDTTKVANVLRVRLDTSLGDKLKRFDTTANGAYKNDSLFRAAFRGLAVKATSITGPGVLSYFNLATTGTELRVYFRVQRNGVSDTTSAIFRHTAYSQANSIRRNPGGEYLANLNVSSPQQLYIQSSPQGSYAGIYVAGLSSFPNKVIHRAELIATKVPSTLDHIFTPPSRLFLDHKSASDSVFFFNNDIQAISESSFDLGSFGGNLRSDNTYRFNITRYVQGIVTRKEPNDSLRLYAPLRSTLYFSRAQPGRVVVPVLSVIANGRVVLTGANFPDPARRLRLRIVYSNL